MGADKEIHIPYSCEKVTVKKVNGKYQFKMPKDKVIVKTTFKKK